MEKKMVKQTVYSRLNPPRNYKERPGSKITLTETAGYMPTKVRIENLINAGVRLDNYRREAYDFAPGEEATDYYDPTRRQGFDPADGSEMERNIKKRQEERAEILKAIREEAAKEKPVAVTPEASNG